MGSVGQPQAVLGFRVVPRKIRLMSSYIDEQLKADPSCTRLELPISLHFLDIVINYCAKFDYLKVMSTLIFPASYNQLHKNVTLIELETLETFNI